MHFQVWRSATALRTAQRTVRTFLTRTVVPMVTAVAVRPMAWRVVQRITWKLRTSSSITSRQNCVCYWPTKPTPDKRTCIMVILRLSRCKLTKLVSQIITKTERSPCMLMESSSLAAPEVIKITTSCVASDEHFINLITLSFKWTSIGQLPILLLRTLTTV